MNTNFIEKQKELAKAISNEHESNYYEEDAWFFTRPALDTLTETIIKNTLEEVGRLVGETEPSPDLNEYLKRVKDGNKDDMYDYGVKITRDMVLNKLQSLLTTIGTGKV